jgi:AcrR family transcriptional regulator
MVMPRVIKDATVRRNEILDAAQRLIFTKGYDEMTIQDILNDLGIAKGLFYYYFASKQAMLVAFLERMMEAMEEVVVPIVQDPHLSALEKLQGFFGKVARWETDQKPMILRLLRVWYTDNNAVVREKVRAMSVQRVAQLLTTIIHQGRAEGILTTPYPDQAGEMILALTQSLEDAFATVLLSPQLDREDRQRIDATVTAYTDAVERVLGAPAGSLRLIEAETLNAWFVVRDNP